MSKAQPANLPASVRQRLLNLSRERGEDFNLILSQYAVERLLYRLSVSEHAALFVLKGAMLFFVWTGRPYRPTRDLDLLGYGDPSPEHLAEVFRQICQTKVEPDGMEFDAASLQVTDIREDQAYEGQRVRLMAYLAKAEITVQVDIGFGDVVTPYAEETEYPVMLDFQRPRLRAYPRETFVAEKLQTIVVLGMPNSRMKDFYDLWTMARFFSFAGSSLVDALRATFHRRGTTLPDEIPTGLSEEFATDKDKNTQWGAFLMRSDLGDAETELPQVIDELRAFLLAPLFAAAREDIFERSWAEGGPWS